MDEERVATLGKLLVLDPDDAFTRYALGLEFVAGEPRRALEYFQEVVRRSPDYVAAYFQSGKAYADLGEIESARTWLAEGMAVAARVKDWHAHGEMEEALQELE